MSDTESEYRCFIGNLSWSTSDRGLKQAFEKYGRLVDAKVVMDKYSGRSRGFGFVTYEDEKDMEEAIEAMNGMDLDGRSITVDRAKPSHGSSRDADGDRGHDRDRGGGGRYRDGDNGGGGRGGSGDGCFKCGKSGHFARECPSSGDGPRGGGGRYGGGGGGRYDSDRDGDRYGGGGGGGRQSSRDYGGGSRSGSGNDRYKRDRSGPYERPSSGGGRS